MYESRKLDDLLPCVQRRAVSFIARCESELAGIKILVTSTFRDRESQDALYSIGRREIAGERIVTNAKGGKSFHQFRVAFDIFPLRGGKSIFISTDGDEVKDPIWQSIARIAKEEGLEWGGDWKSFPEGPHFQYTKGYSIDELQSGLVPTD